MLKPFNFRFAKKLTSALDIAEKLMTKALPQCVDFHKRVQCLWKDTPEGYACVIARFGSFSRKEVATIK